jgi:hypothetical protein
MSLIITMGDIKMVWLAGIILAVVVGFLIKEVGNA